MVPVTDEHTVSDTAFRHWITHVRTTIVNSVKLASISEHGKMCAVHMERLSLTLFKGLGGAQFVIHEISLVHMVDWRFFDTD